MELDGFDFQIIYRPGTQHNKPDALSRGAEHRPERVRQDYQPIEYVLKPGQWVIGNYGEVIMVSVQFAELRPVVKISKWLEEEIVYKAADDSIKQGLYDKLVENKALVGRISTLVTYKDGILFRKDKVWIPNDPSLRMKIMEAEHDSQVAGHMGIDKSIEIVDRNFYWPVMAKDIEDYFRSCEDCQKNTALRHNRHGTLHPLELSYAPWDSISMDFITQLPNSEGCSTV